jgi:hypothetical protein
MHPILGARTIARRVVNQLKFAIAHIIVDGLRPAGHHQIQATLRCQLRNLVGRIHGIVAANVDKVPDIVGPKHLDDPLEIFDLVGLELVATSANRSGRRGHSQQGDLFGRLSRQIQQLLLENTFNSMPRRIHGSNARLIAGRFRDATQGAVDHTTGTTRLSDHQIFLLTHRWLMTAFATLEAQTAAAQPLHHISHHVSHHMSHRLPHPAAKTS